jgi:glycerophosphoryl diester phosphodiesterase
LPSICLALVISNAPAQEPAPAQRLLSSKRPLVIAHRGYAAFAPENTLSAFDRALAAGADLVELDYHHASDGTAVVLHDATLDRTTDAVALWGGKDLPVSGRESGALTNLHTGLWFKPPFPDTLPTLVQALDFIQPRGVTLIERKAGDPATLSRVLRQRDLLNRVVVQAFDWNFLRDFRRLEPTQVTGALGPPSSRGGRRLTDEEKVLSNAWLEEVLGLGAQIVVWNRQVNSPAVQRAHEVGLEVWIYTINEHDAAAALLAMGVDGIITDNPAIVWRALALQPSRS